MQEHSFMDVADPVPEIVQRLGPPPPWRANIIMMIAGVFLTPGHPNNMKAKFMNSG